MGISTRIRIRATELDRGRITDQTGVGSLFTSDADNRNLNNGGAGTFNNHSIVGDRLSNRDITIETSTSVSVKPAGCHHLKSIDLTGCKSMLAIGVSALAEWFVI